MNEMLILFEEYEEAQMVRRWFARGCGGTNIFPLVSVLKYSVLKKQGVPRQGRHREVSSDLFHAGNESARTAHIALNGVNVLLFAWQLPTGFEIAQKVWGLDIPWV